MTLFTFDGKAIELTTETFDDIQERILHVSKETIIGLQLSHSLANSSECTCLVL